MSDERDPDTGVDEDEGVLDQEDTLDDRGVGDVLDEGYSPAERPWVGTGWGTTGDEASGDEPLAGRLARERPDATDDELGDGLGDTSDTDGELRDHEVGDVRAGRLADAVDDLYATDVGIDGGAASAEEAAVHLIGEDEDGADGDGRDAAAEFLRDR